MPTESSLGCLLSLGKERDELKVGWSGEPGVNQTILVTPKDGRPIGEAEQIRLELKELKGVVKGGKEKYTGGKMMVEIGRSMEAVAIGPTDGGVAKAPEIILPLLQMDAEIKAGRLEMKVPTAFFIKLDGLPYTARPDPKHQLRPEWTEADTLGESGAGQSTTNNHLEHHTHREQHKTPSSPRTVPAQQWRT